MAALRQRVVGFQDRTLRAVSKCPPSIFSIQYQTVCCNSVSSLAKWGGVTLAFISGYAILQQPCEGRDLGRCRQQPNSPSRRPIISSRGAIVTAVACRDLPNLVRTPAWKTRKPQTESTSSSHRISYQWEQQQCLQATIEKQKLWHVPKCPSKQHGSEMRAGLRLKGRFQKSGGGTREKQRGLRKKKKGSFWTCCASCSPVSCACVLVSGVLHAEEIRQMWARVALTTRRQPGGTARTLTQSGR